MNLIREVRNKTYIIQFTIAESDNQECINYTSHYNDNNYDKCVVHAHNIIKYIAWIETNNT